MKAYKFILKSIVHFKWFTNITREQVINLFDEHTFDELSQEVKDKMLMIVNKRAPDSVPSDKNGPLIWFDDWQNNGPGLRTTNPEEFAQYVRDEFAKQGKMTDEEKRISDARIEAISKHNAEAIKHLPKRNVTKLYPDNN